MLAAAAAKLWEESQALRLLVCSGGVVLLLGVYGFQQERLMALPYGGEYFSHSVFLVLCNRICASGFACSMVVIKGEPIKNGPPLWKYAAVSISNVLATTCQYEALKFVSFPVQMLGKSAKMVPVMCWGILIARKHYRLRDWMIAFLVMGGCTLFLIGGDITSKKHQDSGASSSAAMEAALFGLLLMVGYLACDGFTSTFQERIFREHNTSTYNQMMYVNLFSILFSVFALVSFGGLTESLAFSSRHPSFVPDVLLLSLCATFGQVFIYATIFWFGALVFAATMNTRQVVSIMVSIMYYAHPVSLVQGLGIATCFAGLFYKTYLGHVTQKERAEADEQKPLSA